MAALTAISEFQHECETAETIDQIAAHLYRAANARGFSYASYFSLARDPKNEQLKFANYPAAFLDHYRRKRWDRFDMITRRGCRSPRPFFWHDPGVRAEMSPTQLRALHEARDFGIRDGYAVPLNAGMNTRSACFFAADHADFAPDACKDVRAITLLAHEHIVRLLRAAQSATSAPLLSPRERECLVLWTRGMEDENIALLLHLSVKTVRRHIEQAQIRFGVDTRQEAVALAIMTGQMSNL